MVKLNCQEKGGSNMDRKGENIFYRKDGKLAILKSTMKIIVSYMVMYMAKHI